MHSFATAVAATDSGKGDPLFMYKAAAAFFVGPMIAVVLQRRWLDEGSGAHVPPAHRAWIDHAEMVASIVMVLVALAGETVVGAVIKSGAASREDEHVVIAFVSVAVAYLVAHEVIRRSIPRLWSPTHACFLWDEAYRLCGALLLGFFLGIAIIFGAVGSTRGEVTFSAGGLVFWAGMIVLANREAKQNKMRRGAPNSPSPGRRRRPAWRQQTGRR